MQFFTLQFLQESQDVTIYPHLCKDHWTNWTVGRATRENTKSKLTFSPNVLHWLFSSSAIPTKIWTSKTFDELHYETILNVQARWRRFAWRLWRRAKILLMSSGAVGLVCVRGVVLSALGGEGALWEEGCGDGPIAQPSGRLPQVRTSAFSPGFYMILQTFHDTFHDE